MKDMRDEPIMKKVKDLEPAVKEVRDPLKLMENILQWIGVLPVDPDNIPKYYYAMVVWQHLMYVNCYLATVIYACADHPFFDKMESIQCILSLFHMLSKYINLHYNPGPYRKLVTTARRMWEEAKTRPEHWQLLDEISKETELSIKVIVLMFAAAVPSACLTTLLYNMQVESEKRETLYMVWSPAPDESWYWTACTYQGVFMFSGLNTLAVTLSAVYSHCLLANGYMKILSKMLTTNPVDMRSCAILHVNVLQYVAEIKDYFAGQLFLELFFSSLQNACRAYMCLKMVNESDPKAVGAICILILCLSGPFIDCLCGHVLTAGSENVLSSSYQSAWYDAPKRDRSSLSILMTMSTKIIRLEYKGLLDFSMERYSMVTQATYSYITLLKGAD